MVRHAEIAAAVCMFLGGVIGCAGDGAGPKAPAPQPWEQPNLERPIVDGNQEGLELRVWAVEDQDALIAELIETYKGRPTPMLDSERTSWRGSGLWAISVPIDELTLARGRMRLIGVEQQDWLGLMPAWREVVPGRRVDEGAMIARPGGTMRSPAASSSSATPPHEQCRAEPRHREHQRDARRHGTGQTRQPELVHHQ